MYALYNVRIFNTVLHIFGRRDWRARVWGGGETAPRKIVRAGVFLNIPTAVRSVQQLWFPCRPYITQEARERDLYRRGGGGGSNDPLLLFPDWIKTPLSLRIHSRIYNMHTHTYICSCSTSCPYAEFTPHYIFLTPTTHTRTRRMSPHTRLSVYYIVCNMNKLLVFFPE